MNACFYDYEEVYPELNKIYKDWDSIIDEYKRIDSWMNWPEKQLYQNGDWKIVPLYGFDMWIEDNCKRMPILTKFLKSLPNLKTAAISRLGPGTELDYHRGWAQLSNYVLRCHIGIDVPILCYINVKNEKEDIESRRHKNKKWIVFDDSKSHSASNLSPRFRSILLIDLERPKNVENGTSPVENTTELDSLIKYFRQI